MKVAYTVMCDRASRMINYIPIVRLYKPFCISYSNNTKKIVYIYIYIYIYIYKIIRKYYKMYII